MGISLSFHWEREQQLCQCTILSIPICTGFFSFILGRFVVSKLSTYHGFDRWRWYSSFLFRILHGWWDDALVGYCWF